MWEKNMVPFIISHWLAKRDSPTSFPFPPSTVLTQLTDIRTVHSLRNNVLSYFTRDNLQKYIAELQNTLRFIFTDGHQKIKKKKKSDKVNTTLI